MADGGISKRRQFVLIIAAAVAYILQEQIA